jgi:methionyl aminopeptidase
MNDDVKEKYLKAGAIASKVRAQGAEMIKEGELLLDVAEFIEGETVRLGGKPAFPVNLAIDSVAAHYTPHSNDPLRFKSGEIVKLDLGVHVDGYIADTAITVEVTTGKWTSLIEAARDSLEMVLESLVPGILVRKIGSSVENTIRSRGFEPVSNLTGHSLERYNLHAGVSIPNVDDRTIADLKPGMAVAIEPFATNGAGRVAGRKSGNIFKLLRLKETGDEDIDALVRQIHDEFKFMPFPERWVAKRSERSEKVLKKLLRHGILATYPILSEVKGGMVSQFEHTVIITERECIVTTR